VLANGIRDDSDASPIDCIGATAPLCASFTKGIGSCRGHQTSWNSDLSVAVFSVHAGAVRLASSADAQRLFASFIPQCRSARNHGHDAHP